MCLFCHDFTFSIFAGFFKASLQEWVFVVMKVEVAQGTFLFIRYDGALLFVMGMFQRESRVQKENELVSFLQLQLAEAINLQDRSLIAHLHETLRCIRLFDDNG